MYRHCKTAKYRITDVEWKRLAWDRIPENDAASLPKELNIEIDEPGNQAAEDFLLMMAVHQKYGCSVDRMSVVRLD